MQRYDVDPVLLCRCGTTDPVEAGMVAVEGGLYIEADEALDIIERLVAELAVERAALQRYRDGCQRLIDRYKDELGEKGICLKA